MGHEREPMKPEISTYSIANQQTEQGTEAVKVEVERLARLLERTQQLDRWSPVPWMGVIGTRKERNDLGENVVYPIRGRRYLSLMEKVRLAGVGWTVAYDGLKALGEHEKVEEIIANGKDNKALRKKVADSVAKMNENPELFSEEIGPLTCSHCNFEIQLNDKAVPFSRSDRCVCLTCFNREIETQKPTAKRDKSKISPEVTELHESLGERTVELRVLPCVMCSKETQVDDIELKRGANGCVCLKCYNRETGNDNRISEQLKSSIEFALLEMED